LQGDTLLTALLLAGAHLRHSEFGDGPRAGFCLMGACQDCWVSLADGRRVQACTTMAEDGMALEDIS
jgi:D-hydroxyproline dehydrogenase subunit gamma